MKQNLNIIGRSDYIFLSDLEKYSADINEAIHGSRILVFGGAGSIGKAIVKELFHRAPAALHVVDISENNLVELIRDLRSSFGYIEGDAQFLPLDMGGSEVCAFIKSQKDYDYILNLAAMKHVRSEKDPYSLMRMIRTNIIESLTTLRYSSKNTKKFFSVSTDKAKNPANMMGATKKIMEDVIFREKSNSTVVSMARLANVAFSDGSLLHGFRQRILLHQPISAPSDIKRYFLTEEESGFLCLLATVLGKDKEIFIPKLDAGLELLSFSDIARKYLQSLGFEAIEVETEQEARLRINDMVTMGRWPCYFFPSDTSGEKYFEEFYSDDDCIDLLSLKDIGIIKVPELKESDHRRLDEFSIKISQMLHDGIWTRTELIDLLSRNCPGLVHVEKGKNLDDRM